MALSTPAVVPFDALGQSEPDGVARTRVAVASSDPSLRLQLRRLLPLVQGFEMVGSARFGEALRATLAQGRPDSLIVDARHDQRSAAEALEIARRHVGRIVVLHETTRLPAHAGATVLPCPTDLALERPGGAFARALALASRAAPSRVLRPVETLHSLSPAPEVIAFGSSTGGPPALIEVFRGLGRKVRVPMLLTQHMPPRFTGMLAQQINQIGPPACEAEQGMALQPGRLYVAPGGQHLTLQRRDRELICTLDDGAPENFCKPSVDVMMRSIARTCRGRALAVILTGMGSDGLLGCRELVEAGGAVIAQDEASSVVWGMPGAVATAGLCRAVLPIGEIAAAIGLLVPR
jgi:two-component system chemotaxis response regulator CheB